MSEDVRSADALPAAGSCDGVSVPRPHVVLPTSIPGAPPEVVAAPALLSFAAEEQYRAFFEENYCGEPTLTFDGISVRFRKRDFDHCAYKSTNRDGVKNSFCQRRAARISLIRYSLQLPTAELYVGWDGRRYDTARRVTIIQKSFVTVIRLKGDTNATFVTSYHCADRSTIQKIRGGPKWVSA